ncbi:MAG: hypothetical protein ABEJ28_11475 [Salinigranum sp.]
MRREDESERDATGRTDDESRRDSGGRTDEDVTGLLSALVGHLEATEELPVDREANAWLGEAQAVAADAARGGPADVVARRVGQVRELLGRIDDTEHPAADEHVARALDLAAAVEARCRERDAPVVRDADGVR